MSQPQRESKVVKTINTAGRFVLMNLSFLVCLAPTAIAGGLWIYFSKALNELNATLSILLYSVAWSGIMGAARFTIRKDDWFDGVKAGVAAGFLRNLIFCGVGVYFGYTAYENVLTALSHFVHGNPGGLTGDIVMMAGSGIFLLAILMFLTAMIPVNLYIDGDFYKWINNTWYLIFHAPLQVLGSTILMWFPLFLMLNGTMTFYFFVLVFVAVYFTLAGYIITIFLKNPLIALKKRNQA